MSVVLDTLYLIAKAHSDYLAKYTEYIHIDAYLMLSIYIYIYIMYYSNIASQMLGQQNKKSKI